MGALTKNPTPVQILPDLRTAISQAGQSTTASLEKPEPTTIPLPDNDDAYYNPSPPAKLYSKGDTPIYELVDAPIFSIITDPKVINELRQSLDLSKMGFKQVEISNNIASIADRMEKVEDHVDQL